MIGGMTSLKLKANENKTLGQRQLDSPVHWHIVMNTVKQKV